MLQAIGLTHTVDSRRGPLFQDISLTLAPGEKVALVGPNGAGKSVLLEILAGQITPDQGRVDVGRLKLAYLPQDTSQDVEGTLRQLLGDTESGLEDYDVARAMHRLGLSHDLLKREFSSLSLGEQMRATLSALIASEPAVLLLDEPTNHLDVLAREWLEQFLSACPETVLFACHDRAVIDAVAQRVLELDLGVLTEYGGNYSDMMRERERRRENQFELHERQKKEDRRLRLAIESQAQRAAAITKRPHNREYSPAAKAYYSGVEARMDKRAKAIRSRLQQARQDQVEKPHMGDSIALEFPSRPLRSIDALKARGLSKSYGAFLFTGVDVTLAAGSRVAVVGPNGCGKTTLFRILLGEEALDAGEVSWASEAQIAVLSQGRDTLDASKPVSKAIDGDEQFVRAALARLGMRGEVGSTRVGDLSVGERTKAEIVAMLAAGANVLVMDEPTNHLDIRSVEALETALIEFPGAVLFTSHDRVFVSRVATEVIDLANSSGRQSESMTEGSC